MSSFSKIFRGPALGAMMIATGAQADETAIPACDPATVDFNNQSNITEVMRACVAGEALPQGPAQETPTINYGIELERDRVNGGSNMIWKIAIPRDENCPSSDDIEPVIKNGSAMGNKFDDLAESANVPGTGTNIGTRICKYNMGPAQP